MRYERKEIVDKETIISKELLDHLQDALELVLGMTNVQTFTSLDQIGVLIGKETIKEIVENLPDLSELLMPVQSGNNTSAYPNAIGNLLVERTRYDRGKAKFWTVIDNKPRIWRGVVNDGVWSGWVEDYNEQNPPPASVIKGVALEADHNIKSYTSLSQLGLSNSDFSSTSFEQNIFKVAQKIPNYGQLNLQDTNNLFVSTLVSRINTNCGTSYVASDIDLINIVKMGANSSTVIKVVINSGAYNVIYTSLSSANFASRFVASYHDDGFLTTIEATKKYLTKEDASKTYLTSSALNNYATKDSIKNFITNDAIKNFITAEAIKDFITADAIKNFITADAVSKTYATQAEHNIKTYTSIEQLGLSAVNDMGTTFSTNITKIMEKLPSNSKIVMQDSNSNFTESLASILNSDLGITRFNKSQSYVIVIDKIGNRGGLITATALNMANPALICTASITTGNTPRTFTAFNREDCVTAGNPFTTTNLFRLFNGTGRLLTSKSSGFQYMGYSPKDSDFEATMIGVSHKEALENALKLRRVVNGVSEEYDVFGTHNKPTVKYTGDGTTGGRQIEVGGNSNAVLITSSSGHVVLLTKYGGLCFKASQATGSNVTYIHHFDACFSDGKVCIDTANDFVNKSGAVYTCQSI